MNIYIYGGGLCKGIIFAPFPLRCLYIYQHSNQLQICICTTIHLLSQAQALRAVITTGSKMSYSDHHLYVIKDGEANE